MGTDKKSFALETILVLLILIFASVSLLKSVKHKSDYIKSVLLNPKYENIISSITIEVPDTDNLVLKKAGNIWYAEQSSGTDIEEKIIFPADRTTVENLIQRSVKLRKLYKKANSIKNHIKLNVSEETAKKLTFTADDGQILSELYFGSENNLTSGIYVRSSAKKDVFETEDDFSLYLNTQSYFYADPYIFPLAVTSFTKSEEASLLRHGTINGFTVNNEYIKKNTPLNIFRKDFPDGSTVTLKIYRLSDDRQNQYTVVPSFEPSPKAGNEEKNIVKKFNYTYSITSWTYEKIISLK